VKKEKVYDISNITRLSIYSYMITELLIRM